MFVKCYSQRLNFTPTLCRESTIEVIIILFQSSTWRSYYVLYYYVIQGSQDQIWGLLGVFPTENPTINKPKKISSLGWNENMIVHLELFLCINKNLSMLVEFYYMRPAKFQSYVSRQLVGHIMYFYKCQAYYFGIDNLVENQRLLYF